MSFEPENPSHMHEHDHHPGDERCPFCRDGEPLLSADEFGRLSLAMTLGMERYEADAVGKLFNGGINTRLLNRVLDSALEGHFLPFDIHESGEVCWRPTHELLTDAEMTRYRTSLLRTTLQEDPPNGSLLTGTERRQLALATATGFGCQADHLEQLVWDWAELTRDMARDLDGILTGRLVPYISEDDPERLIQVKDFHELSDDEQLRYRRAFDRHMTAPSE